MVIELKRAVFNRWNISIFVIVIILMFINSYYGTWRDALLASSATDLKDQQVVLSIQHMYGNTYRVWTDAYLMIQSFIPFLIAAPYLLSYNAEKDNSFRNLMVARKGRKKYLTDKMVAIALSGAIVLIASEFLFYFVTYFLTYPSTDIHFVENVVAYRFSFFQAEPILYSFMILGLRFLYYIAIGIFSLGITSMIKSKIAILVVPFLLIAVLDTYLPERFAPYGVSQPTEAMTFDLIGYVTLVVAFVLVGIIAYVLTERRIKKAGS